MTNTYSDENFCVFDAVFRFGDGMLIRKNNNVMIRYERILRWRVTTKDISEDIFVTAFLARHDLIDGIYCKDFTWSSVISHNNIQLKKLQKREWQKIISIFGGLHHISIFLGCG